MSDSTYDLAEARLLLGREATRHGDWSAELHAAAAVLMRELATLDQSGLKSAAVTAQLGAHLIDPHILRIEFAGGARIVVTCDEGTFVASDPAGKRPPLQIDLQYNAYSRMFESYEGDPSHHGVRRSAATLIMRKALQQLHGA